MLILLGGLNVVSVGSHKGSGKLGPLVSEAQKDAILKAVLYHNRRDLPKEIENPLSTSTTFLHLTSLAAHTVRDADNVQSAQ